MILSPLYNAVGVCQSIKDFGFQTDGNGDPLITECQKRIFGLYYGTKESFTFADALFNNKQGLQDKFIDFWDHTSAHFAKNKYVVGYDPLNEPLVGSAFQDLSLEVPGVADKKLLGPMYSRAFEKYKANDDKAIMWFEPPPQPDTLPIVGGLVSPVGFKTPPGGDHGSANHVLNDHTYCCAMNPGACADEEPLPEHADSCMKFHRAKLGTRTSDAKKLGIPLFISEFGACFTEGPCTQEINQVAQAADEQLVGWAYW